MVQTDGWAGFAFPLYSGEMVGSDAIIVSNCTKCSSGKPVPGDCGYQRKSGKRRSVLLTQPLVLDGCFH